MEDERENLGLIVNKKRKFATADELRYVVDEYFDIKAATNSPFTISGLARHLGVTRATLLNYEKKYAGTEYAEIIEDAKVRIEEFVEECLFRNKVPTTGVIFNLKNNFSWKEKQEIDCSGEMKVVKLEDVL